MTTTILTSDVFGTSLLYQFNAANDIFVLTAGTRLVADGYSYLFGTATGINVMIDGYLWLQGDAGSSGSPFFFAGDDRITIGPDAQMVLMSDSGPNWYGLMLGMGAGVGAPGVGGTDFANYGHITTLVGNGILVNGGGNSLRNYGTIDLTVGAFHYGSGGFDTLLNAGTITGRGPLTLNAALIVIEGLANVLINTGDILASANGVSAVSVTTLGGSTSITNTGSMVASTGYGIIGNGGFFQINNSGTISGSYGAMILSGVAAFVTNTGHIDSNVLLTAGDDTFYGYGGTVTGGIYGGNGADFYYTSDSTMLIFENLGEGIDSVFSTVNFALAANVENLRLSGSAYSGVGNSLDNTLDGNAFDNRLTALGGNDRILGYEGDDIIGGGVGNDTVFGGDGDDWIRGGAGDDNLSGSGDNDTLTGGLGVDRLTGGLDADRFVFLRVTDSGATTPTADIILDFTPGEDLIDLSAIDAKTNNAVPNDDFTFIGTAAFTNVAGQLRYVAAGGFTNVQVDLDGNSTVDMLIRVSGTLALTAQDFVL
jgi:Ca2+-binding RTX toxin-like protein